MPTDPAAPLPALDRVAVGDKTLYIDRSKIVAIESDGPTCIVHTTGGPVRLACSADDAVTALAA
jgi:hypothetical protein